MSHGSGNSIAKQLTLGKDEKKRKKVPHAAVRDLQRRQRRIKEKILDTNLAKRKKKITTDQKRRFKGMRGMEYKGD